MEFKNLSELLIRRPNELELTFQNFFYQSKVLNFTMEAQIKSNWCWAATSNSVSHFYSRFLNPWTQCKIAAAELGLSCCNSPTPNGCNVPWYLDRALTRTSNFVSMSSGTMTWEAVKTEIDKGLVVATRIGWNGGGGHFMVIYGVSRIGTTRYFHIDDPIYGKSTLTVNNFSNNYQGSGRWTHSYITKKHFYFMWRDFVISKKLMSPIPQFRPLLKLELPDLKLDKSEQELELTLPQQVFNLSLKDIGKEIKMPTEATNFRVIELEGNEPIAAYDISANENEPEVLQAHTDKRYIAKVEQGIELLKQASSDSKTESELRLLKLPALNLEALWLKNEGKTDDQYFLIRSFDESDKVLTQAEFARLVQEMKAQVEKQDDTMGA